MGINIKNNIRKVDAKLVNATIDKYGASYPAQSPWRADGFNKVFVETEGANPTQKDFLEGNSSVYVYAIGSNISSLLPYSLASFTNIKELYLFSPTMVNIGAISGDYLTYLTANDLKVYVPSNTLQSYINTYGGTDKHLENRFEEINDGYPLTVSGSGDLTSRELTNQLMNNYESVDRTNCTKLIIQGFTNANSVIWGYDFSKILPNLNNNIWVNGVKFDFSVLNIVGSGTLTEVDIDNAISDIAISNRGGVLEVKISGFSDMSVALTYDYSALPNLEYVWLDNVRYEKLPIINGYQKVEYIESSGTQYINSNILPNQNTKVLLDFEYNQFQEARLFGTRDGNNDKQYEFVTFVNNNEQYRYGTDKRSFSQKLQTGRFTLVCDKNYVYVDNILKITSTVQTFNCSFPLILFAGNGAGNIIGFSSIKIYSNKIYDNDVLVRDYVPCYRLSNNEIGLYDLINNVFYTNQGSGTFLKGVNVVNPTYFYPISDLVSEYNANLNQTFYLDYNGTLPSYPNYQLTYYTDINCTTSILPENMQSGTRYYVKCNGTYGLDFATESWENIKLALENGIATYQLGDTKTITYNNATYTIRICDIGARYDITNGNGAKNHIVCEFVELVSEKRMYSTATNNGGFALSEMKITTLPNIYNNLPSDLKSVIEQVEISSASDGSASGSGSLSYSSNYLFLPNPYELFGVVGSCNIIEVTNQYGLYQTLSDKRKYNLSGTAKDYWQRSPSAGSSTNFCDVTQVGGNSNTGANRALGVAPFFCI